MITFDAVADPSTFAAFQEKVVKTKRESIAPQKITTNSTKNESNCIDIDINVVKALLGGIIKEHTKEAKARLG